MKKIEKVVNLLLESKPFYANFFLCSRVVYDIPGVPRAGAAMTAKGPMLVFNTNFMESLSTEEAAGVVEHEVLHLLFEHTGVGQNDISIDPQIANLAMDAAINQYIDVLPQNCISVESLEEMTGKPLERKQTWEYYYGHILSSGESSGEEFDTHGLGEEAEGGSIQEKRAALRQAIDAAARQSKGILPEAVSKVYDSLAAPHKLPWQQLLSNFVARSISSTVKNTRLKIHRRFGVDQPGKKKKRELTLGVCVDSSGSISDEQYKQFLSEIQRISHLCSTVYLIDADCVVQNVEIINKNKKVPMKRYGSGGTMFNPALEKCAELNCDAIIYFTDGGTADVPEDPKKPLLWVLVGNNGNNAPASFGGVVNI